MPAETERLRRRLQSRDRWFIGIAAVAAVVVTAVFLLLAHRQTIPEGCTTEIVAGFTGGETHLVCASSP
jgi:phosphatidylserine synthase